MESEMANTSQKSTFDPMKASLDGDSHQTHYFGRSSAGVKTGYAIAAIAAVLALIAIFYFSSGQPTTTGMAPSGTQTQTQEAAPSAPAAEQQQTPAAEPPPAQPAPSGSTNSQ
jgi:hypothetical protein